MRQPTRSAAEITAERLRDAQDEFLATAQAGFASMGYARLPHWLRVAVRDLANKCERIGEHHEGLRTTLEKAPPDPDRAPIREPRPPQDWDNELTPVVGPHGRHQRAKKNERTK